MHPLLTNARFRIAAALAVGIAIGAVASRQARQAPRCMNASGATSQATVHQKQLSANNSPAAERGRDPARPHGPPAGAPKQRDRSTQPKHAARACPRAYRVVVIASTVAWILPLRKNEGARLAHGLSLNFGGCLRDGRILAFTRNPHLGGSRSKPKYFVFLRHQVVLD